MSSADRPGAGHRPHPAAGPLAVLLPLLLVIALALPVGIALGVRQWRLAAPESTSAPGPTDPDRGQRGVGDPYFPDYGSSGYDAQSYRISVSFDPATATLSGRTTMVAVARQRLESFYVDLALDASAVTVNAAAATHDKRGFADLEITPATAISAGARFEVTIDYSGRPGELEQQGTTPYLATGAEWMICGEPESSAWWFPANDHPSDPALMDVSIRVPAGFEAVSTGRLASRDTADEADFDTWRWVAEQPMATYLTFFAVGQFTLRTGEADGRPYVYAVSEQLPDDRRTAAMNALLTSGPILRTLEARFGAYPFTELGGIVPAHRLRFGGLETQTRPIYDSGAITREDFAPELIAHELAHMWFGDHVTVREWNDIFINEAYGSYAQWVYTAATGGPSENQRLNETFDETRDRSEFWRVTMNDPGPEQLFSTVYARGPMALTALRNVMGAETFDAFTRRWAVTAGPRSLEDWMTQAQASTPTDLTAFFEAWIFGTSAPQRTPVNGFP